jgi:PAS domain S-box-containing protein
MDLEILGESGKVIIYFGAIAAAITALIMFIKRVHRWFQSTYAGLEWVFSEEHDHKMIQNSLDAITLELTNNGGTSLKDAIDRIEHKQDFMSAHMRTHLNTNSKSIFETDAEGGLIYVNRAYTRMTGFSAHEVKESGWLNAIQPAHRKRILDLWKDAVEARRDFDEVVPFQKPDGTKYDAHAMAYVIRNDAGKMMGHIGEVIPE